MASPGQTGGKVASGQSDLLDPFPGGGPDREPDGEGGALARLRSEADRAVVAVADEGVGEAEPLAGALADPLGGEEGLEDPLGDLGRDPHPGVRHLDHDLGAVTGGPPGDGPAPPPPAADAPPSPDPRRGAAPGGSSATISPSKASRRKRTLSPTNCTGVLISCAMPAASWPTDSSFWAWRS